MSKNNPDAYPGSRRAAPVRGGADRYEALLQVLEQQADQATSARKSRDGGRDGSYQTLLVVILLATAAWLWIVPPRALVPAPPAAESIAQQEASLRLGMYLQAQRVEAYRLRHGRLPETLEELGGGLPGLRYSVLEDGLYLLTGEADRLRLTYRSDQSLGDWVGPGADVLEPRVDR